MKPQRQRLMIIIGNLAIGGGAEGVAATLCNQLVARGYETHILTFYESPRSHPVDGIHHSFHEKLHGSLLAKAWKMLQRSWKIRKLCRKHKIELTVSFLEEANFCSLLSKMVFSPRMPAIVSVRTNVAHKGIIDQVLIRTLYPFAKNIVTVSRGTEQVLRKNFHLTNTMTIFNPIDEIAMQKKILEPLPEEHQWIESRSPLFISIGRLEKVKGHWHLIRAFQKVARHNPHATLIVLGEGSRRKELEQLIEACGLRNRAFLLGNQGNVFPFLKTSGCFVLSSLWEGMSNVLLEALAVGLPILATDCQSSPREILAPDLSLDEKLSYPYKTHCGTLLAPLSEEERYEPLERLPLSEEEETLARVMMEFGDAEKKPALRDEHFSRFQIEEVISQWQGIF